jgi:hypothetical protein
MSRLPRAGSALGFEWKHFQSSAASFSPLNDPGGRDDDDAAREPALGDGKRVAGAKHACDRRFRERTEYERGASRPRAERGFPVKFPKILGGVWRWEALSSARLILRGLRCGQGRRNVLEYFATQRVGRVSESRAGDERGHWGGKHASEPAFRLLCRFHPRDTRRVG